MIPSRMEAAMQLRIISAREFESVLARHIRWLESKGADGALADLNHVDLRSFDLRGQPLFRANLTGADMRGVEDRKSVV